MDTLISRGFLLSFAQREQTPDRRTTVAPQWHPSPFCSGGDRPMGTRQGKRRQIRPSSVEMKIQVYALATCMLQQSTVL